MNEYDREPCPHRIYADAGSAFTMGLVGGSIFHGIKGYKHAQVGYRPKFKNMLKEIRVKSPVTGGQFAAWGGMFSIVDCLLVYGRKKEDPLNSILAGAITGGALCVRMGAGTMFASAAVGGILLGVIEGAGMVMNKFSALYVEQAQQRAAQQAAMQAESGAGGGGGGMPTSEEGSFFSSLPSFGFGSDGKENEKLGI